MVPELPEEIEAKQQLQLLNRDIELEPVSDISEDHDVYLTIYKQALDTPAKMKAIQNRLLAKIEKKKQTQQQPTEQPKDNTAQAGNMLMANALQKEKQPISTQDI
jgi:hypothetical protein